MENLVDEICLEMGYSLPNIQQEKDIMHKEKAQVIMTFLVKEFNWHEEEAGSLFGLSPMETKKAITEMLEKEPSWQHEDLEKLKNPYVEVLPKIQKPCREKPGANNIKPFKNWAFMGHLPIKSDFPNIVDMDRKYVIGIDPGAKKHPTRNNGFAVWNPGIKEFEEIGSLFVHEVIERIGYYQELGSVFVRIENPNLANFKRNEAAKQGAGYVKATYNIYEAFLLDNGIPFQSVKPDPVITSKRGKSNETFRRVTGVKGVRTSEHARIAALYVYDWKFPTERKIEMLCTQ